MTSRTARNKRRREKLKSRRGQNLQASDTTGWQKCSDYHFQKAIQGLLVNWYPSTKKVVILDETFAINNIDDIYDIVEMVRKGE